MNVLSAAAAVGVLVWFLSISAVTVLISTLATCQLVCVCSLFFEHIFFFSHSPSTSTPISPLLTSQLIHLVPPSLYQHQPCQSLCVLVLFGFLCFQFSPLLDIFFFVTIVPVFKCFNPVVCVVCGVFSFDFFFILFLSLPRIACFLMLHFNVLLSLNNNILRQQQRKVRSIGYITKLKISRPFIFGGKRNKC